MAELPSYKSSILTLIEHLKKNSDGYLTNWDEFVEKIKTTHGENNPFYLAVSLAQREIQARTTSDFTILTIVADVAGMADELYDLVLTVAKAVGQINPEQIQSLKDATDRHDDFIINLKNKMRKNEQDREQQPKEIDPKQLEKYIT